MKLTTDVELAHQLGLSLEQLHRLRRRRSWPCVRLGRFEIRFTDAQIEEILAIHSGPLSGRSTALAKPAVAGQTNLSAVRRRSG